MTLTKAGYRPRVIDEKIRRYLRIFGAVSIEGPKWCGKTWTALRHANSVTYLMDPTDGYGVLETARINPSLILGGEPPQAIDEWQEVVGIWDAVRFAVDQNPAKGQYLLTGSATPPFREPLHSGTGRIARLHMHTMSLFESGDSTGEVSLADIFAQKRVAPFLATMELEALVYLTARGGWPVNRNDYSKDALELARQYLRTLAGADISYPNGKRRNPAKVLRLLYSLARNNASMAKDSTLQKDTESEFESDSVSRASVLSYLDSLKRLFVLEEIPAWNPLPRSKTKIRSAPKRLLTDPSLAVAALEISPERLIFDLNTFGFMFEGLCLRDLAVYSDAMDASLYHYRDNSGLEIDAIVETQDGNWGAFEIKLGAHRVDEAVGSLLRMRKKMTENGAKSPACMAVLTGGGLGQQREDGIYIVPINGLRP